MLNYHSIEYILARRRVNNSKGSVCRHIAGISTEMRICGVICEFNPFHAGHAYMLGKAREATDADLVLCLMSGEFTQRGEPAICDKWTRARMALVSGADVVVELPVIFAAASAERFAHGAVRILENLGVDALAFGAENPELGKLRESARIMNMESGIFSRTLAESLRSGASYAAARRTAFCCAAPALSHIMAGANNVLAVEYLRAAYDTGSRMQIATIRRIGSPHDSSWDPGSYPSAAAVRAALESAPASKHARVLDEAGVPVSFEPVQWRSALFTIAASRLRITHPSELDSLSDIENGLGRRLVRASREASSWDELIDLASSRRYPPSRIRRLLLHAVLGITTSALVDADNDHLMYAHVLGVREDAMKAYGDLCSRAQIPVSPSPRSFTDSRVLSADLAASDLYGLMMHPVRAAGADFTASFQIVSVRAQ